jgi:hypothetical protein
MAEIVVREAVEVDDLAAVRRLMQAYGEHLASYPEGAANMSLSGFREELDALHGKYSTLLLATVDGVAAGVLRCGSCRVLRVVAR